MINPAIETALENKIKQIATAQDPAHDILHFKRVVKTAKQICLSENARPEVVIPAAWLHDFVIIPKSDPRRKIASQLSAKAAIEFLKELNYPEIYYADIAHAIEAHSFSANIETQSLEAKVVQDADRLDALGAIGIARCFATAGIMQRSFYLENDPFCNDRKADDSQGTIDHFYTKLFKIADSLKTPSAQAEGRKRVAKMQEYLNWLGEEL